MIKKNIKKVKKNQRIKNNNLQTQKKNKKIKKWILTNV